MQLAGWLGGLSVSYRGKDCLQHGHDAVLRVGGIGSSSGLYGESHSDGAGHGGSGERIRIGSQRFASSLAKTHIKPAKKTNSKYILCGHDMRIFITIGMGKPSMMASQTRSRAPIAKVSLP